MNPISDENDRSFSKLMSKSKLEMPYSDFEDNMMLRIEREQKYKKSIITDTKLSAVFFILGTAFGMGVNVILENYQGLIAGFPPQKILLYFQIIYVLTIAMQFDNIMKMIRKIRA